MADITLPVGVQASDGTWYRIGDVKLPLTLEPRTNPDSREVNIAITQPDPSGIAERVKDAIGRYRRGDLWDL